MRKIVRLIAAVTILLLISIHGSAQPKIKLLKASIAMVIAPNDFTDAEYFTPRAIFDAAGVKVSVASTNDDIAESHDGKKIRVNQRIENIKLDQIDAIVLAGGMGAYKYLLDNEALRNLLRASVKANKVVAAICIAPAVLAHDGILRNVNATCYMDKTVIDILKRNGAQYLNQKVVVSGRIITGNGPEASKEFAAKVLEVLQKQL
jgi:protease I